MKFYFLKVVLLAFCFVLFAGEGTAQNNRVRFSFEVDARPVKEKFKVFLYLDGKAIEPKMYGDSFIAPPEIEGHENAGVRFLSDKHDLYFDPVYTNDFKTDWTLGLHRGHEENNPGSAFRMIGEKFQR